MLTDIKVQGAGLNDAFGVPSADQQQKYYEAVVDSINKSGGVICRKLKARFFVANPADDADLHNKCLQAAAAKVYAVLDTGGATGLGGAGAICYAQHKLPFFAGGNLLTRNLANKFYPYLFAPVGTFETLAHNTVFALRDRGYFSAAKGFKKLGFLFGSCVPEIPAQMFRDLATPGIGLAKSAISQYDFGCSANPAQPDQIQAALLQFERDGVTHVMAEGQALGLNFTLFTTAAQRQAYKPVYGLPDETLTCCVYGSNHVDYDNMEGAVVITDATYGDEHTPGTTKNAATKKCDAIYAAHNQNPSDTWQQSSGSGGIYCAEVFMFTGALQAVPDLSKPDGLALGLQVAKSLELAYPAGPNDFSGNHRTVGGEFWRPVQFFKSCNCFKVIDRSFHPSYA